MFAFQHNSPDEMMACTVKMRIKKFNNGNGAILCNRCRIIVKEGWEKEGGQITKEDWDSEEPIYCKKCLKETKDESTRVDPS